MWSYQMGGMTAELVLADAGAREVRSGDREFTETRLVGTLARIINQNCVLLLPWEMFTRSNAQLRQCSTTIGPPSGVVSSSELR